MINAELLDEVLGQLSPPPPVPDGQLATRLRERFPGIHLSVCFDDDVPPRLPPAAENAHCRLYYVDAGDHCLRLTSDAEAATGLVVALLDDDD